MTTDKASQIANLKLWIAALRSGEYKQAQRRLRRDDSFCCLGVACDVLDPTAWVPESPNIPGRMLWSSSSGPMGCTLDDDLREGLGLTLHDENALIGLNDRANKPFSRIANYIEQIILPRVRSEQEKVQS